ncbi:MAG: PAS domain S-box protein [Elusimicrobia bacterium]|nr:PAS domain S-box protein [Elusimicrobiota bacterium]
MGGEETLRERFEFLQTLIDAVPNPIFYKDLKGAYLGCNKAFEEFFGRRQEEIRGKSVYDMGPKEIADRYAEKDNELLTHPGKQVYEWKVVNKQTGETREVIFNKATFTDSSGQVAGLIGVIYDITEHKKLELALRRSEKLSAVGQLAAGVAHEINNPLGVILGFSQGMLSRIKNDDNMAMPLQSVVREALRCRSLVQDLLVFSRAQKNDQWEKFDLNTALDSAISLIQAQTKTRSVELVVEAGPDLPEISADKRQLQQVLVNLANNAFDAMPQGGTLTVRTGLSGKHPGYLEIFVRDTGTGIPKEVQTKIFEPFFTTKEVGKGTGLGLSLTYEIVQQHNGIIELVSEEGKGTTFTVCLPINKKPPTRP